MLEPSGYFPPYASSTSSSPWPSSQRQRAKPWNRSKPFSGGHRATENPPRPDAADIWETVKLSSELNLKANKSKKLSLCRQVQQYCKKCEMKGKIFSLCSNCPLTSGYSLVFLNWHHVFSFQYLYQWGLTKVATGSTSPVSEGGNVMIVMKCILQVNISYNTILNIVNINLMFFLVYIYTYNSNILRAAKSRKITLHWPLQVSLL